MKSLFLTAAAVTPVMNHVVSAVVAGRVSDWIYDDANKHDAVKTHGVNIQY